MNETESAATLSPQQLARAYDRFVSARWRGEDEAADPVALWFEAHWVSEPSPEPETPPASASVLGASGRGIHWYARGDQVFWLRPRPRRGMLPRGGRRNDARPGVAVGRGAGAGAYAFRELDRGSRPESYAGQRPTGRCREGLAAFHRAAPGQPADIGGTLPAPDSGRRGRWRTFVDARYTAAAFGGER